MHNPAPDLVASARTLDPMFRPRSVAVLGASGTPSKIGGMPVHYLKDYGFQGAIYPINPTHETVQGLRAYPNVAAVEGEIDMAIMAVPARLAVQATEECAAKGVKGVCVFTSGFAEMGPEGAAAQERLGDIARASGMRILGPNCLGFFNARAPVYATFSTSIDHGRPRPGNVGLVTQSGAFGAHCFVLGRERGLGFSFCATTGNEVDVDVADCLAYLALDDDTRVIAGYMEGCKDGDKFRAALQLAYDRGKPVIIQKVGRSEVGGLAAASHTASLAGADRVYDAVFERYNVHRVRTAEELIDVAYLCSAGIVPNGNRFAVATISGGAGILMADAAADAGLEMPAMPEATQARLKALVPFAATRNPVDFTAQVYNDFGMTTTFFEAIFAEGGYDAVVGFFTSLPYSDKLSAMVLDALLPVRRAFPDRLFVLSVLGPDRNKRIFEEAGFPIVEDPSRAVETVAAVLKIGRGFARGLPALPTPSGAPKLRPGRYNEAEAKALLAAAGVPAAEERLARSADEAVAAADAIGYPAVLKIVSADIPHKSEAGGVLLNLADAAAVRAGYATIMANAFRHASAARIDGVLVARMIAGGVETILGVQRDPVFGPVVMFGLGGIFTEIMGDVTFRLAPFDEADALAMIRSIKGYPLLAGARGRAPADVPALARALSRLSAYAGENADTIRSIDVNPLVVLPEGQGVAALDALIVTGEAQ